MQSAKSRTDLVAAPVSGGDVTRVKTNAIDRFIEGWLVKGATKAARVEGSVKIGELVIGLQVDQVANKVEQERYVMQIEHEEVINQHRVNNIESTTAALTAATSVTSRSEANVVMSGIKQSDEIEKLPIPESAKALLREKSAGRMHASLNAVQDIYAIAEDSILRSSQSVRRPGGWE